MPGTSSNPRRPNGSTATTTTIAVSHAKSGLTIQELVAAVWPGASATGAIVTSSSGDTGRECPLGTSSMGTNP